jgi:hypothetical protein
MENRHAEREQFPDAMPRPPKRGDEISDEMTSLWREGCALLDAMNLREYERGESKRHRAPSKRSTRN